MKIVNLNIKIIFLRRLLAIVFVVTFLLALPFYFVFAYERGDDAASVFERKEELKNQMSELQQEIENYRNEIAQKKNEEKSLSREVSILNNKIKKTELELRQTALAIRQTDYAIEDNNQKIREFEAKIENTKSVISEIMRSIYQEDSRGVIELIVSSGDLSDFLDSARFLDNLQSALKNALDNIRVAKKNIEEEQLALEQEQENQYRLKTLREVQANSLSSNKQEKNNLLNLTQAQKQKFELMLSQKERDIEQIRNQIFLLEGVGISLPLHEAYRIAKQASDLTGIRPAFLLAILKQESSWGANVGQCFLVDPNTGVGKGKNTGNLYNRVMKPSRDVQPFLAIVQELGRDPYNTLVSCPHPNYGYGGAMGPAQFIPSTWMGYKDRLTGILGHTPDPWDINDAFTASALKLANGGADEQTYNAEWKSAMIYYAGGNWNNSVYAFYGDSVMDLASAIQQEINVGGEIGG